MDNFDFAGGGGGGLGLALGLGFSSLSSIAFNGELPFSLSFAGDFDF